MLDAARWSDPCPPWGASPCRRQDEDLDQLSHHVVRIGELGKEMGQELHLQASRPGDARRALVATLAVPKGGASAGGGPGACLPQLPRAVRDPHAVCA